MLCTVPTPISPSTTPARPGSRRVGYVRASRWTDDVDEQRARLLEAGCTSLREEQPVQAPAQPILDELVGKVLVRGDTLVVVTLDRLGGTLRDLVALMERLTAAGIELHSLDDDVDTTNEDRDTVVAVFRALGRFDRARRGELSRDGMERARAQGRPIGAPAALPPERDDELRRAVADGLRVVDIAAALGVSRNTVLRRLRVLGLRDAPRPRRESRS